MDIHPRYSFFTLLALSLPLFCGLLLLSWASSAPTATSPPPFPPPSTSSSVLAAADGLRTRGYSLFASVLVSTNLSGTILAPPDFAFSFATAKFSPNPTRRAPPRPSTTLLLYHALIPPSLAWLNLTSVADGDELQTFYNNHCLFLFKNPNGDVFLSSSKKPLQAVTIRQPDLYVDDNLIVHGIDGVLDPTTATKCSLKSENYLTDEILSRVDRSFIDHVIRVLRRRGFQVVATAMALKSSELFSLTAITIFAPSDRTLFSQPDGFRYDFRHHIVPRRLRFSDLVTILDAAEFETLAPNKTVFVQSIDEAISVNGVIVDGAELYHNRWIVVYSISKTLDDAHNEFPSPSPESNSPGDMSGWVSAGEIGNGVPIASPASNSESIGTPSPSSLPVRHISDDAARGVAPMSGQEYVRDNTGELVGPSSPLPESHIPEEVSRVPGVAQMNSQENGRVGTGILSGPPSLPRERRIPTEVPLGVPEVAPANGQEQVRDVTTEPIRTPPSPSPERHIPAEVSCGVPGVAPVNGNEDHLPDVTIESMGPQSPSPSPVQGMHDIIESQCAREAENAGAPAVAVGIEGADLFCPVNNMRSLQGDSEILKTADAA